MLLILLLSKRCLFFISATVVVLSHWPLLFWIKNPKSKKSTCIDYKNCTYFLICRLRYLECKNILKHWSHWSSSPVCCIFLCFSKANREKNTFSLEHSSHGYCWSSGCWNKIKIMFFYGNGNIVTHAYVVTKFF